MQVLRCPRWHCDFNFLIVAFHKNGSRSADNKAQRAHPRHIDDRQQRSHIGSDALQGHRPLEPNWVSPCAAHWTGIAHHSGGGRCSDAAWRKPNYHWHNQGISIRQSHSKSGLWTILRIDPGWKIQSAFLATSKLWLQEMDKGAKSYCPLLYMYMYVSAPPLLFRSIYFARQLCRCKWLFASLIQCNVCAGKFCRKRPPWGGRNSLKMLEQCYPLFPHNFPIVTDLKRFFCKPDLWIQIKKSCSICFFTIRWTNGRGAWRCSPAPWTNGCGVNEIGCIWSRSLPRPTFSANCPTKPNRSMRYRKQIKFFATWSRCDLLWKVNRHWHDLMRKTMDRPNALKSAIASGVLETLQQCNTSLEKVSDTEDRPPPQCQVMRALLDSQVPWRLLGNEASVVPAILFPEQRRTVEHPVAESKSRCCAVSYGQIIWQHSGAWYSPGARTATHSVHHDQWRGRSGAHAEECARSRPGGAMAGQCGIGNVWLGQKVYYLFHCCYTK